MRKKQTSSSVFGSDGSLQLQREGLTILFSYQSPSQRASSIGPLPLADVIRIFRPLVILRCHSLARPLLIRLLSFPVDVSPAFSFQSNPVSRSMRQGQSAAAGTYTTRN